MNATYYPATSGLPFSKAVRVGGFVFLSGQIPLDVYNRPLAGSIEEQTHAVLKTISSTLTGLGSSLEQVIKTTVWLNDLVDSSAFNEVYQTYFSEGRLPVRSLVQARLAFGVGVEIEVQAVDPDACFR
jgi:2-iminobutanoate/2-iminopropanoate deaminase